MFDPSLMFYLIMDSGCSVTATPYEKDFLNLHKVKEPSFLKELEGTLW